MRHLVLDTETTGLDTEQGHRIIEIGCVELINRRITGQTFHYYLNPERAIDPQAQEVHGLSNEFLADKPLFSDIASEFLSFAQDATLIIHNAPFDIGFLDYELGLANIKPANMEHYCQTIDTLMLARELHPGQRNSLDALCKRYQVNNKHREWHGALLDSELLAQVYLLMTGGQSTLFQATEMSFQGEVLADEHTRVRYPDTLMLMAQPEEVAQHQKFMTLLQTHGDITK